METGSQAPHQGPASVASGQELHSPSRGHCFRQFARKMMSRQKQRILQEKQQNLKVWYKHGVGGEQGDRIRTELSRE